MFFNTYAPMPSFYTPPMNYGGYCGGGYRSSLFGCSRSYGGGFCRPRCHRPYNPYGAMVGGARGSLIGTAAGGLLGFGLGALGGPFTALFGSAIGASIGSSVGYAAGSAAGGYSSYYPSYFDYGYGYY